MSQLEPPASEETDEPADDDPEVAVEGRNLSIEVPDDATQAEAAAVAATMSAYVSDRQRAALAAASAEETAEQVDQWVLAARMRRQGKRRWPLTVERGNEWRAAARSF